MLIPKKIFLLIFSFWVSQASALGPITIDPSSSDEVQRLHKSMQILVDQNCTIPSDSVVGHSGFVPYSKTLLRGGAKGYWIRFSINNTGLEQTDRYLNTAMFDSVEVYVQVPVKDSLALINKSGFLIPKKEHEVKIYFANLAKISIPQADKADYYVRIYATSSIATRLTEIGFSQGFDLYTYSGVKDHFIKVFDYTSFVLGALFLTFIFSVFLAIKRRSKVYFWLAINNLVFIVNFSVATGFCLYFIDNIEVVRSLRFITPSFVVFMYFLFGSYFLELDEYVPKAHKGILLITGVALLSQVLLLNNVEYHIYLKLAIVILAIGPILLAYGIYKVYRVRPFETLSFIFASIIVVFSIGHLAWSIHFDSGHYYKNEFYVLVSSFIEILIFTYVAATKFSRSTEELVQMQGNEVLLMQKQDDLQNKVTEKSKQLISLTLSEVSRQKELKIINSHLDSLSSSKDLGSEKGLNKVKNLLSKFSNSKSFDEKFLLHFRDIEEGFLNNLNAHHTDLSANEVKLCAYLRINLNSSEMATLLGIEQSSVNQARFRLRKKLGLSKEQDLVSYLHRL